MSRIDELIAALCPEGVGFKMLEELGATYGGLTGKSKADFSAGNARFVSYKNIFNNLAVNLDANDFVKVGSGENQNFLVLGDVLFTGSSETPDEVGMSSVVIEKPSEAIYLNSFCFGYRFNNDALLLPTFSKYLFRSYFVRQQIVMCASGVTRFNISKKRFLKVCIPIPPTAIQYEIVKVLDTFTTLEAELEARRRQYQYYRDALLTFEESTDASGNGEDGAEKNQWKPTGINRIDELIAALCPEGVEFKRLGNVTRIRNGKDHKLLNDGHIPVYGSGGIMRYVDTYAYDKPSVLIPRKGSLGNLFYVDVPFWNVDTIFYTEVDESQVLPKFLYYFLTTVGLGEMNQAGGVPSQTQSVLNELKIPIPPLEVQARIVAVLDQFDTLVNDITAGLPAEIAARRQQYAYYRDRLLTFKEAV
ncbi:restriction endonuclease subunit S [Xylella fastidiosa]|uniref:restriction endonuclease subunit S n=1 Tax=Xylella fastidiosa TaxID=2371 RepID=UPI000D0C1ABA|nr:restriction endonuclease subunit S [Xylella fastidiosa]AVI21576.1 hypothetical protein BCV75_10890 [Xylella fastidiosa]AVI23612.1 hypothetical protein BC375_10955 [Xylella fastidiosa]